jgi:ABC-2 type transport system ATP-binding protein
MKEVIICEGLTFSYNGYQALDGLSFTVRQGEVFALLGPNGAGKTTTIRVLNGLLHAQSGQSRVLGLDPVLQGAQIRRRSGVLTETPALYERLSAWQNLRFFGSLAGMPAEKIRKRGAYYLDLFELSDRADDRVETYSKGMKQRLALARALLHDPELLFLDEPTSGMDPAAARQVEGLIYRISKQENRSVILCTHRLYEAEKVCDRVAVMKTGSVIACGSLEELRNRYASEIRVRLGFGELPPQKYLSKIRALEGVLEAREAADTCWELRLAAEKTIPMVIANLVSAGIAIYSVVPQQATLEDIYLRLQGVEAEAE